MVRGEDLIAVGLASMGAIAHAVGYVVQKKGHNQVNKFNNTPSVTPKSTNSNLKNKNNEFKYPILDKSKYQYKSISNNSSSPQPEPISLKSKKSPKSKSFVKNYTWISGFGLYLLGSVLQAVALRFGAQSVIAPFTALTLVANTILAAKFLNEPLKKHHVYGTLVVLVSSTFIVIFGPNEGSDPTLEEFKSYYFETIFLIFAITISGITFACYIGVRYYEFLNESDPNNIKTDKTNIIHGRSYLMISYVYLSAYYGAWSALLIKSGVLMIATMNEEYIQDYFFYTIILFNIIVNFLLEFWRQKALGRFGAMFVVPMYQVLYIIGAAIFGAIYFDEFATLELYETALFSASVFLTIIGVIILAFDMEKIIKKLFYNIYFESFDTNLFEKQLSSEFQLLFT